MARAEANGWLARVDVVPVVVGVGDVQKAGILVTIAVAVTDKGGSERIICKTAVQPAAAAP